MNILFISPNSPEVSIGGIERYIDDLITYCQNKEGRFIFLLPPAEKIRYSSNKNIKIYRKSFLDLSYRKRKSSGEKDVPQKEIREKSRMFFDFLLNLLKTEKIDIVSAQNFHVGLPPAFSLMLNMACFSQKIPLVLRLHSFPSKEIHENIINQLLWEKIICVSKSVAGDCFQKGTDVNKLATQHLGVDLNEFKPTNNKNWLKDQFNLAKDTKIILTASRIIQGPKEILKEKGILNLIIAFSKLSGRFENLKLVIAIGKAPKRLQKEFLDATEKLKGFIKLHNLENKVFYKTFDLNSMPLVYNGADIFVLASENETLGQVYIEAMACGNPVIGTKTGGVPEIISDNYNGFLILPNDPSILSQKIELLIKNHSNLKKKFKNRGLKTVQKRFSSKHQLDKLFNSFKILVNN